jgi:glycosyltransferase involved in cell wall biosynthesis
VIKKLITTFVAEKANFVTVDSESLMKQIVKFGAPEKKVGVISHGVSLAQFSPNEKSDLFRKTLNIPSGSEVIVSTRNLEKIYDVETLVRAIPKVIRNKANVHFFIIGEGTQKSYLQELAQNLDVQKHVTFLGKIPNTEVGRFLANSDVYVSTSLSDSTSVSLLEAMASQLPVVVTDIEGNREWVKDNVNGFVVPKSDPDLLAEKIKLLIEDKNASERFGARNREIAEEKASYDKEMERVEKIYEQITREP